MERFPISSREIVPHAIDRDRGEPRGCADAHPVINVACEDLTEPDDDRAARKRAGSPPLKYCRLCSCVVPVAQAGPPRRIPAGPPSQQDVRNPLDRLTNYRHTRELRGRFAPASYPVNLLETSKTQKSKTRHKGGLYVGVDFQGGLATTGS